MKLLVIRPQPGADATALRAEAVGFEVAVVPLFAIEPVAWAMPQVGDYDALMLTSGNAVRQAGDGLYALKDLPTYVVGTATARAVEHAGLAIQATGDAGVDARLLQYVDEILLGHEHIGQAGEDDAQDDALGDERRDAPECVVGVPQCGACGGLSDR